MSLGWALVCESTTKPQRHHTQLGSPCYHSRMVFPISPLSHLSTARKKAPTPQLSLWVKQHLARVWGGES